MLTAQSAGGAAHHVVSQSQISLTDWYYLI